jgi:hypothetical protein
MLDPVVISTLCTVRRYNPKFLAKPVQIILSQISFKFLYFRHTSLFVAVIGKLCTLVLLIDQRDAT